MFDLYFYRETTDTYGNGVFVVAASPVQQPVFEQPTFKDYNTGETLPLEFQLDDLFHDTTDVIGGT
jgi:hypothetical protein